MIFEIPIILSYLPNNMHGMPVDEPKIEHSSYNQYSLLVIINIQSILVDNKQQYMNSKRPVLLPRFVNILEQLGENIKLAKEA